MRSLRTALRYVTYCLTTQGCHDMIGYGCLATVLRAEMLTAMRYIEPSRDVPNHLSV